MTFEITSLGELSAPLLFFGGPYSNLEATQAMRDVAETLGIPPQKILCTGDILAYCGSPCATLDLIREWGIHVVRGNCEVSFGTNAPDCGCGFEEGSVCSTLSDDWYRFALTKINDEQKEWMRNLPPRIDFTISGRSVAVVHGGVDTINRFIFPSTAESVKQEELRLAKTDIVIGGHSGIPSGTRLGDKAWLNTGVIGMPANDGTRDGWYMLLNSETSGILRFSWHRLHYNADKTAQNMREHGLCGGYDKTLLDGLWPSMDILPDKERQKQGHTIEVEDIFLESRQP